MQLTLQTFSIVNEGSFEIYQRRYRLFSISYSTTIHNIIINPIILSVRMALILWNENDVLQQKRAKEIFHYIKETTSFWYMYDRSLASSFCSWYCSYKIGIKGTYIFSLTWYIDDGWDRKITRKNLNNFVLVRAISNSLVGWLVARHRYRCYAKFGKWQVFKIPTIHTNQGIYLLSSVKFFWCPWSK